MRLEAQGPLTAAEVVLHALAALPMLVRGVVGMPMFLQPLYMVRQWFLQHGMHDMHVCMQ